MGYTPFEQGSQILKLTYSIREAATVLGIGREKCYQLVKEGTIPTLRLGMQRNIRIPKAALERFVNNGTSLEYGAGVSSSPAPVKE